MSMVFALACARAEQLVNSALSYVPEHCESQNAKAVKTEPENQGLFADIAGKSLHIIAHLPPVDLVITCNSSEVFIQPGDEIASDTPMAPGDAILTGSAPALILLAMETRVLKASDNDGADTDANVDADIDVDISNQPYDGSVEISGDTAFVMALRERLQNLDIDWEAWLATFVGDIPSHLLAKTARHAKQWQTDTNERAADGVENYFRNEWSSAPWQESARELTDTLVALGSDRELAKQRLESLKSQFLRFIS